MILYVQCYCAWVNTGRPHDGLICVKFMAAKRAYKLEIWRARAAHKQQVNSRLMTY